jgi:ABC-type multidrug transport system ATPase subunit
MIVYQNFSKHYGKVIAASNIDLEVRRGETLALIGPNGSGKTTALKAALGLLRPTSGRVLVAGHDVAAAGITTRGLLGYLPQRLSFREGTTARGAMQFYAALRGCGPERVEQLLDRVGLLDVAHRRADEFSGGMRQRLGLAIALIGNPAAILLDEPSAALDPSGTLLIRDMVADMRSEGRTVLLSSHDLTEVASLADRIAIFMAGRIVAVGTVNELSFALGIRDGTLETIYRAAMKAAA